MIQNSVNNEGNFRELLKFRIDSGDNILKNHLQNCPKNASFISKTTQNDLIDCCASVILHKIVNVIKESKYFSILIDETSDISTSEQLVLCIRYVFHDKVQEDFLKLVIVENTSGLNLSKIILHQLDELGLNIKYLRGQGYGGGAIIYVREISRHSSSNTKNSAFCIINTLCFTLFKLKYIKSVFCSFDPECCW